MVEHEKSLTDIERGFKVLESEIEMGPGYHRLPKRIRARAQICFMASILPQVVCNRLKSGNTGLSPERALEQSARIQRPRIRVGPGDPVAGVPSQGRDAGARGATVAVNTRTHRLLKALLPRRWPRRCRPFRLPPAPG